MFGSCILIAKIDVMIKLYGQQLHYFTMKQKNPKFNWNNDDAFQYNSYPRQKYILITRVLNEFVLKYCF